MQEWMKIIHISADYQMTHSYGENETLLFDFW